MKKIIALMFVLSVFMIGCVTTDNENKEIDQRINPESSQIENKADEQKTISEFPQINVEYRNSSGQPIRIKNGSTVQAGTRGIGQNYQENSIVVSNKGREPLEIIMDENGSFLRVSGDGLRSYNYNDSGNNPIEYNRNSGSNGTPRFGIEYLGRTFGIGTYSPLIEIHTNDPETPVFSFSLEFQILEPAPALILENSERNLNSEVVIHWEPSSQYEEYILSRRLPSENFFSEVYKGSNPTYIDLLGKDYKDIQIHYLLQAVKKDGGLSAGSRKSLIIPDADRLDKFDYSGVFLNDDNYKNATPISIGVSQAHNIYPMEDVDFFKFDAVKGKKYKITVLPISPTEELKFHFDIGNNGAILIGPYYQIDNSNPMILNWVAPDTGVFFMKLRGRFQPERIRNYDIMINEME